MDSCFKASSQQPHWRFALISHRPSMDFHSVAVEKTCAIRSYRWKRVLEHAFRFFNLSLLLFLLSRSSCIPCIPSLFHHPLFVFLLLNLIILFIFALSPPYPNSHSHSHLTPTPSSSSSSQLVPTTKPSRTSTGPRNARKVSSIDCHPTLGSDNFSCRIAVGGSPELSALNPVSGHDGDLGRRLCSMEALSKEDFNRTVEEYIARQRRMLWEEHRE